MKIIQSVDKAMGVLEYIALKNGELTLTDISTDLGIKISTLHGLIATLEQRGFLYKKTGRAEYHLGVKLFELGKRYEADLSLIDVVRPRLRALAEAFNETVHLAVPFDKGVLYIDKVESKHPFRLTSMVGTVESPWDSAIGRVILANLGERDVQDRLPEADGGEDHGSLFRRLKEIRQSGHYIRFEKEHDFYCIAVPLLSTRGMILAAISAVVPNHRYDEALSRQIVSRMKEASRALAPLI